MYHKIGINELSQPQIQKLLKGDRIRVKFGKGLEINASEEQYKKIGKAHKKGCGVTIQFDPYQMENHQFMRGQGVGKKIKQIGKTLAPIAKKFAPIILEAGMDYLESQMGNGIGKKMKGVKGQMMGQALMPAGSALYPAGYGNNPDGLGISAPSSRARSSLRTAVRSAPRRGRGLNTKKGEGKQVGKKILKGIEKYGPTVLKGAMEYAPLLLGVP